ncbi:MAG: ADP-forming succinate--CoA ligase subunit beta [Candidatus Omnitrophica bacterium]|nr:ADP-forming succinate--CoA ligase subunit beta [Candidatus Omnitrophota bacterium]MCA9430331.1 ADP-forming succinate--CoA ligase subunit beta [Candidatus Omnitrophota bacterium]MCA9446192.1 ADP-forming succinate--CoA ligase subunit beta [Candidatus Omnitrophota bacterium]
MKIHEYQAKELFRKYGVPVPNGKSADTIEEAVQVAKGIDSKKWVVKAQIHAGGRGKGGGVKLADSIDEVKSHAESILGMTLVTHQTGPEGRLVQKLLVEEALPIKKELYVAILFDRTTAKSVLIASASGGMEIEEVAATNPEAIIRTPIDTLFGLQGYQARNTAFALGLEGKTALKAASLFMALYKTYVETDSSLAEINPMIVTEDGDVLALDGKMNFDDNALYRHPDIAAYRDLSEEEELEIEASKHDLNYIKLDGNVGCMVNGAGLAMATMDIIKHAGGEPANFLDVGGGASVERVAAAFKILMSDPHVKAVLVNIFGGIVRCDRVAGGIIQALEQVKVDVPLIVRLEGTNAEEAAKLLDESDLDFLVAKGLKDAAEKVTGALKS